MGILRRFPRRLALIRLPQPNTLTTISEKWLTSTDPIGNVTNNSYDGHGNLLSVTSPPPSSSTSGSTTQFAYDAKGELTQITDPLGNVTKLTYYPTGLINTITDAQQNVTTYVYDAHGNRTSVTDAMNKLTTFAYDTGDRLEDHYVSRTAQATTGFNIRLLVAGERR